MKNESDLIINDTDLDVIVGGDSCANTDNGGGFCTRDPDLEL